MNNKILNILIVVIAAATCIYALNSSKPSVCDRSSTEKAMFEK